MSQIALLQHAEALHALPDEYTVISTALESILLWSEQEIERLEGGQ